MTTLDPLSIAHSVDLTKKIRQEIHAEGAIPFARFMELALYAPGLGYYSAGSHKLGKGGDFVTAPEISPLFAQCVAHQCGHFLTPDMDFLEIGAGTGIFARDFLTALEKKDQLPREYYILEVSAELRQRQQQLLATHSFKAHIHWLDALPKAHEGIIFANEVLDAMPVTCFSIEQDQLKERLVGWENDRFTWCSGEPSVELQQKIQHIRETVIFPDSYASEINLMLPAWLRSLADTLKRGALLLVDYGYGRAEYYHPGRNRGTLTSFFQHRASNDPFQQVGLQDITAHVDFTFLAEEALSAGFSLAGFTTQASFLLANGLVALAATVDDPVQQYNQAQAIKTLTLPGEMGDLVKVMGFQKNSDFSLNSLIDRRRDL